MKVATERETRRDASCDKMVAVSASGWREVIGVWTEACSFRSPMF